MRTPGLPYRWTHLLLSVWIVAACSGLTGCASPGGRSTGTRPIFGRKGVPWTILCLELTGEYGQDHIESIARTLRDTKGISPGDVIVSHDENGTSRLYHGRYLRRTDSKTRKRRIPKKLAADLKLIKELGTGPGQYLFIGATMVPYPVPDVGNPDWALAGVDAAYSLQVAVFEPTDDLWDFKSAAADYCAALRAKGFEAYYHHSRASSAVTVGAFGEDAVINQPQGLPLYSREVGALQQQDELLKYNRLNGSAYRARDDAGKMSLVPSRLVHIPRDGEEWSWTNYR